MKKNCVVNQKQKKVADFQESLGDTVVLLLELKTTPGITKASKREIDDMVEQLQTIIRELPELAKLPESFRLVFGEVVKKLFNFFCKVA